MKLAIAGDSAGEGLARTLAEHLKNKHEVAEISRTQEGADPFYADLSERVASAVLAASRSRLPDPPRVRAAGLALARRRRSQHVEFAFGRSGDSRRGAGPLARSGSDAAASTGSCPRRR